MDPGNHRDRAFFAAVVIFLHEQPCMLTRRHHYRGDARLVRLYPYRYRSLQPVSGSRMATIQPVPMKLPPSCSCHFGDGRLWTIDRFAFGDVFDQRTAIHFDRRVSGRFAEVVPPPFDQFFFRRFRRQAQRQRTARARHDDVGEHAVPGGKTGDVVKKQRQVVEIAHEDIDQPADVFLRFGTLIRLSSPIFDFLEKVTKIFVGHVSSPALRYLRKPTILF